jgi:hypothetical protein
MPIATFGPVPADVRKNSSTIWSGHRQLVRRSSTTVGGA